MSCEYARSNGYAFALEKFRGAVDSKMQDALEEAKKHRSHQSEYWRTIGKQDILLEFMDLVSSWIGKEHEK